MPKLVVFGIVRSLHDLFTALWIGGMLTTAISFMPVFKKYKKKIKGLGELLAGYQNQLSIVAIISIAGLWITGLLLSKQSPAYSGFLNFSTTTNALLTVKHLIIILMIFVALYRRFVLGRNLADLDEKKQKIYGILLMVNSLMGIIVLVLSGVGASLSQAALMSVP